MQIFLNKTKKHKINHIFFEKIKYTFLDFIKLEKTNEYSMKKFKEFIEIFEEEIKKDAKSDQISIFMNGETKNISKQEVLEVFQLIVDKAA